MKKDTNVKVSTVISLLDFEIARLRKVSAVYTSDQNLDLADECLNEVCALLNFKKTLLSI